MGNKIWIGAAVLVAGLIFWGVGQAVNPSSGDTEFQKTLEALKQVKSFRGSYNQSVSHTERLWEVDCNRVIVHQQSNDAQSGADAAFAMREDELLVGDQRFTHASDGSWTNDGYAGDRGSAKWYCDNMARATVSDLLPDIRTILRHALFEKGDKKTVNGVQCRMWKFAVRSATLAQQGSMCVGVDDHLPYEMITDGGHYSYSDYNRPIQFEAPDAVLQATSASGGSN
jgi:hypothetical protein